MKLALRLIPEYVTILLLLATTLALASCSTCKCKTIDDKGKIRDADINPILPSEKVSQLPGTPETPTAPANTGVVAAGVTTPAVGPTGSSMPTSGMVAPAPPAETTKTGSVRVYKYDNSRQCGQGKASELTDMAKELKNVKILSQEKRNDGMMRIQMCGAPTGVANVYEIEAKDLKKAIKAGFREWKYSVQ